MHNTMILRVRRKSKWTFHSFLWLTFDLAGILSERSRFLLVTIWRFIIVSVTLSLVFCNFFLFLEIYKKRILRLFIFDKELKILDIFMIKKVRRIEKTLHNWLSDWFTTRDDIDIYKPLTLIESSALSLPPGGQPWHQTEKHVDHEDQSPH